MKKKIYQITFLFLLLGVKLFAQSPVSGFMNAKGKTSISISSTNEKYGNVFLVPNEIEGVPVFNKVEVSSISFYGVYGISNKLNLVMSLPYIKTSGMASEQVLKNLNYQNERSGIQDLSIYGKYKLFSKGNLDVLGSVGVQTPLGKYKVNEGLQSIIAIGNRATQINSIATIFYKLNNGLFLTGQGGYSVRSKNVPNAVISEAKVGYAGKFFYVDSYVASQLSMSGVDILGEGFTADFTATRVSYTRVGGTLYAPVSKFAGISFGLSKYLSGRNLANSTGVSLGLSTNF